MSWWGEPWPSPEAPAPVCADPTQQIAFPPPGTYCVLCDYEIQPGDAGSTMSVWTAEVGAGVLGFVHKECSLRSVLGNHIHVRGLCSAVGDCERMSKMDFRHEALAVWQHVVVEGQEPVPGV